MITLLQYPGGLIGSLQAVKALETKEHARVLLVSDSHGATRDLLRIIRQYGKTCDAFIFCGDGAHDLEEVLQLANEDQAFNECVPSVIAFVRGNGDPSVFPVSYDIGRNNPEAEGHYKGTVLVPENQTLTVNGQKIFISHGHWYGVDFGYENFGLAAKLNGAKIAIHGHTHIPVSELFEIGEEKYTFINPGSISRPRGGTPASFAILTVEKNFIDTAFIKILDHSGTAESFQIYTPIF